MQLLRRRLGGDGEITIALTDIADGNFAISAPSVASSREQLDPRPWTWLRLVHGPGVVDVTTPGQHSGATADAAVSDIDDAVLAVQRADCAAVVFWSVEGPFGIAHAGWRGLSAGVIEATADALRTLGASDIRAVLGPCIHPGNYEFGQADLECLTARFGSSVRAVTSTGAPALDVPATVFAALSGAGVRLDHDVDVCTGRSPRHYSHRIRADVGRHCVAVVRTATSEPRAQQ